jgi:hypothetical protein
MKRKEKKLKLALDEVVSERLELVLGLRVLEVRCNV